MYHIYFNFFLNDVNIYKIQFLFFFFNALN